MLDMFLSNTLVASSNWDLTTFLENALSTTKGWISGALMILGLIAVAVAVYRIVAALMSQGQKPLNLGQNLALFVIGGALLAGGFALLETISQGGTKTIEDLGSGAGGTIMWLSNMLPRL